MLIYFWNWVMTVVDEMFSRKDYIEMNLKKLFI